jgi:hypothetical protein
MVRIKVFKYIFAVWFSILLLIGNTPMDFIHLFADHEDTVHKEHTGLVIEKKHHHCAFVSLTLTSFVNDYYIPSILFTTPGYFVKHTSITICFVQRNVVHSSLRGPPVA